MKKYVLKISQLNVFLCFISSFILLLLISFAVYDEFAFIDIVTILIPIYIFQHFFQQTIFIENDKMTLKEFGLVEQKEKVYSIDSISHYQKRLSSYSLYLDDREIVLSYCMYNKSQVVELVSILLTINPTIKEHKKIIFDRK